MNSKRTNKDLISRVLLIVFVLFSFEFLPALAHAITIEFASTAFGIPLDEPRTLRASCEQGCPFIPSPLCTQPCSLDVTWEWTILPPDNQPDASYDFILSDTPNPVFTPYTKGEYNAYVQVCRDQDCASASQRLIVFDPNFECPLSSKYPFVIYESPAFPGDAECDFDADANGLNDLVENKIAQCFVPKFAFDAGEECWSLGRNEPYTVYNIGLDAVDEDAFHLVIRYGMVWQFDGGFQTDWLCSDSHLGDTQGLTVTAWLRKREGRAEWFAELESISGFHQDNRIYYVEPPPHIFDDPLWAWSYWWMYRDETHPLVYPTAGKHHFRAAPGEYVHGDICDENALGNLYPYRVPTPEHVPHFPSASSVNPENIGPQFGPPVYTVDDHKEWANSCSLLKGNPVLQSANALRNVDLQDWTFSLCSIYPTSDCCSMPELPYPPKSLGGPEITDTYFLNDDYEIDGIWKLVSGNLIPDVDGDLLNFWEDPCPVVSTDDTIDSDSDGLCDPVDICPNDPTDDADGDGLCGTAIPTCDASEADAHGPYSSVEGTAVIFDASGSNDACGGLLEYRWDFDNDGSWDTDWSSDPTAAYTWGDNHIGLVRVEVRDQSGSTDEDTAEVTINNMAPTASIDSLDQANPLFILPLVDTLTLNGSFTDPGWLDTHTAEWDFGDGSVEQGDLVEENDQPDATGTVTGQHVYSAPGTYSVTLSVTDDDNGVGNNEMEVTVVGPDTAQETLIEYLRGLMPTGDEKADKRIEKAVENIEKSLNEKFWEEGANSLSKYGKEVFEYEKKAVKELMKLLKDGDVLQDEADFVIQSLLSICSSLAIAVIEEDKNSAAAKGCTTEGTDSKCDKILREIAKAQEEMGKAQQEIGREDYDKAVEHYKKAWDHAMKAMKEIAKYNG